MVLKNGRMLSGGRGFSLLHLGDFELAAAAATRPRPIALVLEKVESRNLF